MFKTRLFSGIVLTIITVLATWLGGPLLMLELLTIAVVGLFEFYRATGVMGDNRKSAFYTAGVIGTCAYGAAAFLFHSQTTYLCLIVCTVFFAMMLIYVVSFPKYESIQAISAFFGFIYVSVMIMFIYLTRELETGIYVVWLIYITSWICDTFAYCTGRLFGKHKLAKVLSPKKSIEGSVGGVAGSALVAFLIGHFLLESRLSMENVTYVYVLIATIGAIISQIGDLTASAIKRNHDIKDYGTLIPGHGGILDRYDSVIFTAPMIYFLAVFFLK